MRLAGARWPRHAALLLALTVGLLGPAAVVAVAQAGTPVLTVNQVLAEQYPQVVSYVTVVDGSGLAVTGLTKAAFTVREEGSDVTQFNVSPASQEGINVVLALDASGSMLAGTALRDAQVAARAFLSQLTPTDRAGLAVFAETADLALEFTADRAALEAAVDAVTAVPNARTALYEAAFEAGERLAELPAGRKAIIVFTDGRDTVGGFTLKDAIDSVQEANAPVYTIGLLGGDFDAAPMRQLAEATGGFYLETPDSSQLAASFEAVRELLEAQYAIRYTSLLRPGDELRDLSLGVTVDGITAEDRQSFLPLPLTPWVDITTPADEAVVAGTVRVAVEVAARDSIREVDLLVDGMPLSTLAGAPYRYDWDTAVLAEGAHVLAAQATDDQGRSGSRQVSVVVQPSLTVALTAPADGSNVVGLVDVRPEIKAVRPIRQVVVAVDGVAISTLTASPYTYVWDTADLTLGPHVLTVTAEDEAGASAQAEVRVQVQPALTMALSSPADGASVVGVVDVQPDIQAERTLRQVLVAVDATPVATVPAPPYTYRWDTAELAPGPHEIRVSAVDERGATAQAQVQVNVQPVVTTVWLSPLPGDVMTSTVTLRAQAQAHYGVERVEFFANDQLLGAVKAPPFRLEWSTLNLEEQDYRLAACAIDVLGHQECAGATLELKRPGPGAAMFIALGFLFVVIVLVTVMVVRSRQRQAAARGALPAARPAPAMGPQVAERPGRGSPSSAWFEVRPPQDGAAWRAIVRAPETFIGRAAQSDIQLDDELASRQHAAVRYDPAGGNWVYRDLSPTNPSVINGEAYREPWTLRPGDSIVIGSTTLIFGVER